MQQNTAGLHWQQDGQLNCLHVTGDWTLHQRKPDLLEVWRKGGRLPEQLCVRVRVDSWDSSLLALLRRIRYLVDEAGIAVNLQGLPDGVEQLLEMAATPVPRAQPAERPSLNRIGRLGQGFLNLLASVGRSCTFVGQVSLALLVTLRGRGRMRSSDFWLALQQNGPGALPIVALIATLVGLILAFVGAVQLEAFGAQIYIANMVAIGMTREMGALMTAVIMAGRTGAAYAAELGSMQANEEIDALQTFGFPPLEFLVTPRILALLVSMPILTCFADILGILGGFLIGWGMYDISAVQYLTQSLVMVSSTDFFIGLFKSLVFALLIGMIGCYYGLNSGRNAQAVGQATTNAVVSIIVALVVSDAMITVLCTRLGI